jgi:RHS repeat-associated protein
MYDKDAAGNVVETITYSWNQENRLVGVQSSNGGDAISYEYDANGVRVSKTVNGVRTEFLVDKNRDYAQVLEESVNGVVAASYVYGLDLISQERGNADSYYLVDGLGSTRGLTDAGGVVTDTYSYDAFGNLIASAGATANNYLFAGEQFDSNLDQYYLRQRYYNQNSGRFTRRDTYEGSLADPMSLHKYLYGNANPVTYTDPTGLFSAGEAQAAADIANTLAGIQWESGQYLIGATLNGGEYDQKDFVTDLAWNLAFSSASTMVGSLIGNINGVVTPGSAAKVISTNADANDAVSRYTIRQIGMAIADKQLASRVYSRLQDYGVEVFVDVKSRPFKSPGVSIAGEATPHLYRIDIYLQNNRNTNEAVSTLIHEASHMDRAYRGIPQNPRYEEYIAFRREALYNLGIKPTLQERKVIWENVNALYSDLPVGKSPFN